MKILFIDNNDSFTFNIVHILRELKADFVTVNVEDFEPKMAFYYDKTIISPGPGLPSDYQSLIKAIKLCGNSRSILGICLGHQAIAVAYGCSLKNLETVYHGIPSKIFITDKKEYLFKGFSSSFNAGRYHSWVVDQTTLPNDISATAFSADGEIMALAHKHFDVRGVQFHPESFLTPFGKKIIRNWLKA